MDMQASQPIATVVAVIGNAIAKNAKGETRKLEPGDLILEGEIIITMPGGHVELAFNDASHLGIVPNDVVKVTAELAESAKVEPRENSLSGSTLEKVIQALEQNRDIGEELEDPSAGFSGGTGDLGNGFVRLLRIAEGVDPIEFDILRLSRVVENVTPLGFEFGTPLTDRELPIDDDGTGTPPNNDNDIPTVSVAVAPASVAEDGVANLVYTFTLSNASDFPTTVNYTLSGTAANGTDYTGAPVSGSLTIPAGSLTATLTIDPTADATFESNETVIATIDSASTNGQTVAVTGTPATGTITDDDAPPVLDLDANNSSGAAGANYTTSFTENGAAVVIADTDVSVTDVDSTNLTGATITLTNAQAGDVLAAGALPPGITASIVGNVVTLSGSASLANYQTAIRAITFNNTSENPSTVARTVTVVVTDGTSNSNTATTTINVTAVNDPPVANNSSATSPEDPVTPISITLTGSDVDGTVASYILASLPANGQLYLDAAMTQQAPTGTALAASGNALTLYFAPLANWNGVTTFDYTAVDNDGLASSAATGTITVTPVDDGAPLAANDNFATVVNTPIIISKATLLGNDYLPDNATFLSFTPPSGGSLVDNGDGTLTYTAPAGTGPQTFTYTVRDDMGQTSTATVTVDVYQARDDLVTVHESALPDGNGGGVTVVSGNLFANDGAGNTSISRLNFNGGAWVTDGGAGDTDSRTGYIGLNTTNGNVVVDISGAGAGTYTYTLTSPADNSAAPNDASITEVINYDANVSDAALRVTIMDDEPNASDITVQVPEAAIQKYTLVLAIDTSGSMSDLVRNVKEDGTVELVSRLDMAKQAIAALITEYFNQSSDVQVKIISFNTGATILNGGAAYTSKDAAIADINGLTAGGYTNYEAALNAAQTAFGTIDPSRANYTYFLSDGDPTYYVNSSGNNSNSGGQTTINAETTAAVSAYSSYATSNSIKTFAVGMGSGITNTTFLDGINNVDSLGDGVIDPAIIVPDLTLLDETLLSTIPAAFGGNVLSANGTQNLTFGADGGNIQSVTLLLDTDGNSSTPEQSVTFTYNDATNQITRSGTFPPGFPISGDLLTLNAGRGFTHGTLTLNFTTGDYTYFTDGIANEGDSFDLNFVAIDNDGDTATGSQTISVVDGKPVANADTDTLSALSTFLEGNVITGEGTDGGLQLGSQLTTFTPQGSGVDNPVDNAQVSSVTFKGVVFDLTTSSSGSAAGGSYTITAGKLTWAHGSNGSSLVFDENGYYKYGPPTADIPNPATSPTDQLATFTSATSYSGTGVTLQGMTSTSNTPGSGTVVYNNNSGTTNDGAGVNGATNNSFISNLESLIVSFDRTMYAQGVQGLRFNINNGGTDEALTYIIYGIDGSELGRETINANGWNALPSKYSNVGQVVILAETGSSVRLYQVEFDGVLNNAAAAPVAPEILNYTLTDSDGDSSSTTLTLNVMTNHFAGGTGADTITGTGANDEIHGLAGNDSLNGGAGHDIIQGGADNDIINAGTGDDTLSGEAGDDTLHGDAGTDMLRGGDGHDSLFGDAGNDRLEGGDGNDTLTGGDGNDILIGGTGNDTLTGELGVDVFQWSLADRGTPGSPAIDTITDFDILPPASGGDVLDLRDLLVSENHDTGTGNLASFLHFEVVGSDTKVHISSTGGFSHGFTPSTEDQVIILQGIDLVAGATTDQQIIQTLLNNNKLITD